MLLRYFSGFPFHDKIIGLTVAETHYEMFVSNPTGLHINFAGPYQTKEVMLSRQ
jgi:hypothetical protein